MWTHFICDTFTGEKLGQVYPIDASANRLLNGAGTGSHTFDLASLAEGPTAADRRFRRKWLLRPWRRTLVQCWNDKPRYAGLINKNVADIDKGIVTARSSDVREILSYRTTLGVDGYSGERDGKLEVKDQTLRSLAATLLWAALQGPTDNWRLPFVLPNRDEAGIHKRVWRDYNMPVIEDELTEIQNAEGGPDIDLDPAWSDTGLLEWRCRVGVISGIPLDWNLDAPTPQLTNVTATRDATKQATTAYAVGDGTETDILVHTARGDGTVPALERIESYSQIDDRDVLQAHANADVTTFRYPTEQNSFSMKADGSPGVQDLVLGQPLRFWTKDHDWFEDGWKTSRLLGYQMDLTNDITLQTQ